MSIDTHIHACPRKTDTNTIYPDGVLIWDNSNKQLSIGDGSTLNGRRVAMLADLTTAVSAFLEEPFTALTSNGSAAFSGERYVHHLVGPSGTIYTVASGDCGWNDGNTYVDMETYLAAEDQSTISGTWIAVFNPRGV